MTRVTCASCGAPTVLGASRCPKCLAPFGVDSPTSGVRLHESATPRPAGRSWRWVAGLLGLLAVVALVARWRRPAAAPLVAPGATPAPVAVTDTTYATDSVPRPDSGSAAVAVPDVATGVAPGAPAAGAPAAGVPAAGVPAMVPTPAPTPQEPGITFTYEATTYVRVRASPSNEAEVVTILPPGARVEVAEIGRGWLRVQLDGVTGWVGAALLTRVR